MTTGKTITAPVPAPSSRPAAVFLRCSADCDNADEQARAAGSAARAAALDLDRTQIFFDRKHGLHPNRQTLALVRYMARDGEIEVLAVSGYDRLSRDPDARRRILGELRAARVRILTSTGTSESTSASDLSVR